MVGQLKPDKPDVVATFSILIIGSERSWCTLLIEQKCHELLLIQSCKAVETGYTKFVPNLIFGSNNQCYVDKLIATRKLKASYSLKLKLD